MLFKNASNAQRWMSLMLNGQNINGQVAWKGGYPGGRRVYRSAKGRATSVASSRIQLGLVMASRGALIVFRAPSSIQGSTAQLTKGVR